MHRLPKFHLTKSVHGQHMHRLHVMPGHLLASRRVFQGLPRPGRTSSAVASVAGGIRTVGSSSAAFDHETYDASSIQVSIFLEAVTGSGTGKAR